MRTVILAPEAREKLIVLLKAALSLWDGHQEEWGRQNTVQLMSALKRHAIRAPDSKEAVAEVPWQ